VRPELVDDGCTEVTGRAKNQHFHFSASAGAGRNQPRHQ
jgi:hypothetical protein